MAHEVSCWRSRRRAQGGKAMNNRFRGVMTGATLGVLHMSAAVAQEADVASAGNGGIATASANGGAVGVGDVNSGGNAGNADYNLAFVS